jgi:DNA replication protein DnaC
MPDTLSSLADFADRCNSCNENRYTIDVKDGTVRAIFCRDCFHPCPACEGEEHVYYEDNHGYRYVDRCRVCGALADRITAFNRCGVPARYGLARLQSFVTTQDDQSAIGNLPQVKLQVYQWLRGFTPKDRGFVVHGSVGTGKTYLLASVVNHLTLEKGISTRFVEFTHLLGEIREKFDRGRSESDVLDPLTSTTVLAIDELGKGRRTDWQLSIIDELISKRYNRGLTTIFTTNYRLDEPTLSSATTASEFRRKAVSETLRERVGDRVFSRLHEMAVLIPIDAPDFRRRT